MDRALFGGRGRLRRDTDPGDSVPARTHRAEIARPLAAQTQLRHHRRGGRRGAGGRRDDLQSQRGRSRAATRRHRRAVGRRPPTGCWRPDSARRQSAPSSAERRTSWSPSNRQTSPPSLSRSRSANANRSRGITTSSSRRAIWESLSATNNMTHTLRTTAKRWGIEICTSIPLPLSLFAAGVFMCFAYIKEGGPVWGVVVFVVWTIVLMVRAVADVLSLL